MSETPVTVPFVSFRPMERGWMPTCAARFACWTTAGTSAAERTPPLKRLLPITSASGTASAAAAGWTTLVLILKAMGIGPGDESCPVQHFYRHGAGHQLRGRSARAGRADARKLQHRPRPHRGRRDPAHEGHHGRAPLRPVRPDGRDQRHCPRPRPQGHRGRRPGPRH